MHCRFGPQARPLLATLCLYLLVAILLSSGCGQRRSTELVVYTSVDQVFSEPILQQFERQTGIRVSPVYDIEAAKTTGLVNRLIAEQDHPLADVFWSGEFAQTILLQQRGVLQPYHSPAAEQVPAQYRDASGYWTGFAGRVRVLMVNTETVADSEYPRSITDLLAARGSAERIGIAYPLFGTTATQAAALYAALGPEEARSYFEQLQARGCRVVDGNSVVRDLVVNGTLDFGLTDSDDACGALARGDPVAVILPDQDGLGTLIIPNTVAIIADAPHLDAARLFVDYLLSPETDEALVAAGWSHVSLRGEPLAQGCLPEQALRGMDVSLTDVYAQLERAQTELREIFVR